MIELYKAGLISQQKFSLSLQGTLNNSYIDLGPIDATVLKNSSDMTYIPVAGDVTYWQNNIDGLTFSNGSTKWQITAKTAIVDSGWTTLAGPSKYITFIKQYIL